MIEQFFMPLHQHFDGGFHATGEAFKIAAEKLSEDSAKQQFAAHGHLPVNYLYRHAIELYLKSIILTLTRVIEKSTVPLDPTKVKIQTAKDRPLTSVHSLNALMNEHQRLVTEHNALISRMTPTNWNVPDELQSWISTIEAHDGGSTFSRYPTSNSTFDTAKSSFQQVDLQELAKTIQEHKSGEKGQVSLLMQNDEGEVVQAFRLHDEVLPDLRTALVEAAKLLSGGSFGLQAELADGYGLEMLKRRSAAGESTSW